MSDTIENIPPPRLLDDRSMGARVLAPRKSWQDELRERIDAENIIDRFQNHLNGTEPLEPTQIKVGEILLRKKLPDLAAVQIAASNTDEFPAITRIEIVAASITTNDNSQN